jgi:hypothetical protein
MGFSPDEYHYAPQQRLFRPSRKISVPGKNSIESEMDFTHLIR